jgi:polyhydroxyalkanoate synthesis repressor PhaR
MDPEKAPCQAKFVAKHKKMKIARTAVQGKVPERGGFMLVKKYGNRRLYDTDDSRYITLEELTDKIRAGADAQIVDAKTGKDLTQATLTQIIVEGRQATKLLPVPFLLHLVRMGDDALAEFFGRYVTGALELYLQAKQGASVISNYNPFAMLPFSAGGALARFFSPSPGAERPSEVAELRKEVEQLKRSMRKKKR